MLTTSGHQKMVSPNLFRLHLILGEEERACYKAKMWWVDRVFPTSQGGSHTLSEEKVNTSLCNKTKQMETPEEDKAAKNVPTRLTNTHCWISFCLFSLILRSYGSEYVLMQGEVFPWCESLPLVSALITPQITQSWSRAKMYASAFTLLLKHLGF